MGIRAEIDKDSTDARTFGVLALRFLGAQTRDDAAVYYVKKVMIPAWGNAIADDIKPKNVLKWLKILDYSGPTIGKIKAIMHAVYQHGVFEDFCSSNPCSGWRLKGVKSYKAILVTPNRRSRS